MRDIILDGEEYKYKVADKRIVGNVLLCGLGQHPLYPLAGAHVRLLLDKVETEDISVNMERSFRREEALSLDFVPEFDENGQMLSIDAEASYPDL